MSGSSIVVVTRSPFTFNVLDIAIALPSGSWHAWAEILAMKLGAICRVARHDARQRRLPKAAR